MMTRRTRPYGATAYDLGPATLRAITAADAAALGPGLAAIDPWRHANYPAEVVTGYLMRHDPAANRFAIYTGDTLAGVVSVREPWLRGPYLELLALLPPAQGQGIGAAVMRWFEAEARPDASSRWVLCSDFNTRALAFYDRHGFRQVAPLEGLLGEGLTEILLRKRLDRG
jgi:GNAT superfamily N-acetyltransferase